MSTWTSESIRRLVLGAGLCLALPACLNLQGSASGDSTPAVSAAAAESRGGGFLSRLGGGTAQKPLVSAELDDGIVVAGPVGYCIDKSTVRRRGGGFAVLGSCRALTGGRGATVVEPAIMTVTLGGPGSAAALPGPAGFAAALGESTVERVAERNGTVVARITSGGDSAFAGADPGHWRALTAVGDRMVALAVYAPAGGTAAGASGETLILSLAQSIRTASTPAANPSTTMAKSQGPETTEGSKSLSGFFRGLFKRKVSG